MSSLAHLGSYMMREELKTKIRPSKEAMRKLSLSE